MLFNGTIGGKTFTNYVVATGTVDVGKKEIDEIVITDITAPAAKKTLDTSASTSTTGCDLSAVSWTSVKWYCLLWIMSEKTSICFAVPMTVWVWRK